MAHNVKAVFSSVAVCGLLFLAGCGGFNSTSAGAGWNPPRPTGVSDERRSTVVDADAASLPGEDHAGGQCQVVKPEPAEVDAKDLEQPGATAEEFNALYDYVIAQVSPLCAELPPATGAKGVQAKWNSSL